MKLIIMRGVSGSGKSTLAQKLSNQHPDSVIYSTDDFFMVDGKYIFDPKMIGENHQKNQKRTQTAMINQISCIIVDNTNCQAWEMKPYVELALLYDYQIELQEPEKISFEEIMSRQENRKDKSLNKEIVKKMLSKFEENITIEEILKSKRPF